MHLLFFPLDGSLPLPTWDNLLQNNWPTSSYAPVSILLAKRFKTSIYLYVDNCAWYFFISDLKLLFLDKFVSKKVWKFHSNYVCLSLSDSNIKILEDQFDELIVETATRRKQWPKKILVHAIQAMKAEQEMLVSNLRLLENFCIKKSIIQCWLLSSFPLLLLILYHKMRLLFFSNWFCSN